jgi:hypothetical protein
MENGPNHVSTVYDDPISPPCVSEEPPQNDNNMHNTSQAALYSEPNVHYSVGPLIEASQQRNPDAKESLIRCCEQAARAISELLVLSRSIDPLSAIERLRPTILENLQMFEVECAAWSASGEKQGFGTRENLRADVLGLTANIIASLDFNTEQDSAVFWTGFKFRNNDAATEYARSKGKTTIEMTRGGVFLDGLDLYGKIESSSISTELANSLFDVASRRFAEAATGNVVAVIYDKDTPGIDYLASTYHRIERPILWRSWELEKIVLREIIVPPEVTLPLLNKIDRLESSDLFKKIDELEETARKLEVERDDSISADFNSLIELWTAAVQSTQVFEKTRAGNETKVIERRLEETIRAAHRLSIRVSPISPKVSRAIDQFQTVLYKAKKGSFDAQEEPLDAVFSEACEVTASRNHHRWRDIAAWIVSQFRDFVYVERVAKSAIDYTLKLQKDLEVQEEARIKSEIMEATEIRLVNSALTLKREMADIVEKLAELRQKERDLAVLEEELRIKSLRLAERQEELQVALKREREAATDAANAKIKMLEEMLSALVANQAKMVEDQKLLEAQRMQLQIASADLGNKQLRLEARALALQREETAIREARILEEALLAERRTALERDQEAILIEKEALERQFQLSKAVCEGEQGKLLQQSEALAGIEYDLNCRLHKLNSEWSKLEGLRDQVMSEKAWLDNRNEELRSIAANNTQISALESDGACSGVPLNIFAELQAAQLRVEEAESRAIRAEDRAATTAAREETRFLDVKFRYDMANGQISILKTANSSLRQIITYLTLANEQMQCSLGDDPVPSAQAYSKAANRLSEGHAEAAACYYKCALAHEKHLAAEKDPQAAAIYKKIAIAYGGDNYNFGAGHAHQKADETKRNPVKAELWRQCAEAYEAQATALLEQVSAMQRGDTDAARYSRIAEALGSDADCPGAAYAYALAAEECFQGDPRATAAWTKCAEARMAEARAVEMQDIAAVTSYGQIALYFGGSSKFYGVVHAYRWADDEKSKGNLRASDAWLQCALASEAAAVSLELGDEETAELYRQRSKAFGGEPEKLIGAAYWHCRASEEEAKGNALVAEDWCRKATMYELEAAAIAVELSRTKPKTVLSTTCKIGAQIRNFHGI